MPCTGQANTDQPAVAKVLVPRLGNVAGSGKGLLYQPAILGWQKELYKSFLELSILSDDVEMN
jgi:hypothetical protein